MQHRERICVPITPDTNNNVNGRFELDDHRINLVNILENNEFLEFFCVRIVLTHNTYSYDVYVALDATIFKNILILY